jgi:AbrB family looped-hinge helix DNA binding protein
MRPVNMLLIRLRWVIMILLQSYLKGGAMDTTRLSERGQIVIPKRVRTAHGWEAGLEFIVEDAGDSIKLKPIKLFKKTTIEEVRGCLHYKGPRKSLKDMEAAIAKGAKESK